MRTDYPETGDFADAVRLVLYGNGDICEHIKGLADILAKYDGVPTADTNNRLFSFVDAVLTASDMVSK